MARRGRPRGSDSAATRSRIIDAARTEFATRGFVSASIATIAGNAGLAASAVYHYFGSKDALYEEVFHETINAIWTEVHAKALVHKTVYENLESVIESTNALYGVRPHYSDFLALAPIEARIHTQFAHLIDHRRKLQDETFGALAEIGLKTGELAGFDLHGATEVLRSLLMGWFFERYFQGDRQATDDRSLLQLCEILAARQTAES